jgi:hypothetical protein
MRSDRLASSIASLTTLADNGAHRDQIAELVVATWRDVFAVLSHIIGHRGVLALFERSLHLQRVQFPWLSSSEVGAGGSDPIDNLREALSTQSALICIAAHNAVLESFCDLSSNLIGTSLTERLLDTVWDRNRYGSAVHGE